MNWFLFRQEVDLAECADGDGYDLLTLRDPANLVKILFAGYGFQSCVTRPKLVAAPTSEMLIRYDHIINENDSIARLRMNFLNTSNSGVFGLSLPLTVRVNGEPPKSLDVDKHASTLLPSVRIDSVLSSIWFSYLHTSLPPDDYAICDLIVRVDPSPILRHVTLEYAEFGPYMTGIFEPPNSACNYVMFLDDSLNAWRPELVPTCMCGDADNNGQWTLSDAVYLLVYIFDDRHELTETCRGDANGTGSTNISDVAYLIDFLVGGGPTPHCP